MECPACEGRGGDTEDLEPPPEYRGRPQYKFHTCTVCEGEGQVEHYCDGCGETDHDHDENHDCPLEVTLHDFGRRGEGVSLTDAATMGAALCAFKVSDKEHPGVGDPKLVTVYKNGKLTAEYAERIKAFWADK